MGAFAGDLRNASLMQANAADARSGLGDFARAAERSIEALALSERLGADATKVFVAMNLGMATARLGRHAEGAARLRGAIDRFVAQSNRRGEGGARIYLARVLLETGALAEAEEQADRAVRLLGSTPPMRAHALATLGEVLLAQGKVAAALGSTRGGLEILQELGRIEGGDAFVRLAHARALARSGDAAEARAVLAPAAAALRASADRIDDLALRTSYLQAVPEHRGVLELAEELGASARRS
jgi:tetratricopeptide (TPR) repeat protein